MEPGNITGRGARPEHPERARPNGYLTAVVWRLAARDRGYRVPVRAFAVSLDVAVETTSGI